MICVEQNVQKLPIPGVESVTQRKARTEALTRECEEKHQTHADVEGYHNKLSFFRAGQEVIRMLLVTGVESVAQHKARTDALMLEHAKWCELLVDGYPDKSSFLCSRLLTA